MINRVHLFVLNINFIHYQLNDMVHFVHNIERPVTEYSIAYPTTS